MRLDGKDDSCTDLDSPDQGALGLGADIFTP
jgi:hypothetical protein